MNFHKKKMPKQIMMFDMCVVIGFSWARLGAPGRPDHFFAYNKTCSPSLPSGNQVDGLPLVLNYCDIVFHYFYNLARRSCITTRRASSVLLEMTRKASSVLIESNDS